MNIPLEHTFFKIEKLLIENTNYAAIKFDHEIKLDKYCVQGKYFKCILTSREFECFFWTMKDKTAKQIAKILSLSPRTVEEYLANIKHKLGCQSKFELKELAYKDPALSFFIN